MAQARHYPNAPITEAIIDLRVKLPPEVGMDELRNAHSGEEQSYPQVDPRNLATGRMRVGKEITTTASSTPIGYWFRSDDGRQIFQARLDGFTMSRLAPYQRWEVFRDEARRLWERYIAAVQPREIDRVAVRYINRIDIPLPLGDFKEYLRTSPEVSPDLPQGLAGFFMRLMIPLEDAKCRCLLNEAIVEPAGPKAVSVALDIDVFRTDDLPDTEQERWELIEQLRRHKNAVFEACITDKARELFQ